MTNLKVWTIPKDCCGSFPKNKKELRAMMQRAFKILSKTRCTNIAVFDDYGRLIGYKMIDNKESK